MVDFVKGKTSHPVGAGLVFPRGFNEKVVTPSGEVWLEKGWWNKTSHPVGAGLVFPRGFNEKVVTPSGEVWLEKGWWKPISQSLMWTCGEDLR